MKSYDENEMKGILENSRNIAVVGISDKPERPSYGVALYLHQHGYNIIPINPNLTEWNGIPSYPSLESVKEKIDVVDVFRRPETVMPVVEEAVRAKAQVLWLQEGVINEEAADYAKSNGLKVVMDRCMKKEHYALS